MISSILIRADGSARIGLGHVMRCLALAQGLRRAGAEAAFLCRPGDGTAQRTLAAAGFDVYDVPEGASEADEARIAIALAKKMGAGLIVVDHYGLREPYRCALAEAGLTVAVFDDTAEAERITAAAILNQNMGAETLEERYRVIAPGARALLLGLKFALLREDLRLAGEFIRTGRIARWNMIEEGLRRPTLLLMMGGADTMGLTPRLVAQLCPLPPEWERLLVVCGPAMPEAVERETRRAAEGAGAAEAMGAAEAVGTAEAMGSVANVMIARAPNLAEWYAEADVAITAGGSTTMELAYCGVPMLIVQTADNQRLICDAFRRRGVAAVMSAEEALAGGVAETVRGWPGAFSRLREQATALMKAVDEAGAVRAAAALMKLPSGS